MLGPRQFQALLDWLADGSQRVKVLVTSVPLYEHVGPDKWSGFVTQRDQILDAVRERGGLGLLVVSGDVHASMASELVSCEDESCRIVSVVASSFFWPYPHPRRRTFRLEGCISTRSGSEFQVQNATKVYPTDCFARLDIDPSSVNVRVYGRKGGMLVEREFKFGSG